MIEALMETKITHINLTAAELTNKALENGEGTISANNAFRALTGNRTGRSPKDRFIVKDEITENTVEWGAVNQPISEKKFAALYKKAEAYIANKESYVSHLRIGEDEDHYLPVEVVTELAWHNLFARNLFIRPHGHFAGEKDVWKILNVPGLKTSPEKDGTHSDGTLCINFKTKQILICGLLYAGEMKKAMFSVMNFLLPEKNVLPMHCAANCNKDGDVALFFGLSGTGKTTLSADPERLLIGDDEHGWSEQGVFNFEGGCYAKCIDLSEEREPLIWNAIRSGAIMENVVLDPVSKLPDYSDSSITQNTRVAYPREFITQRSENNFGGHPNAVIFLCCDLYGVLPPVAQLTKPQAAYYFLSGYTALVGSTEVGQTEAIKPTFSTCFGAPFFPRNAGVYAEILLKRLETLETSVYLVNTGWTGGPYGKGGHRFAIPTTRSIISAILSNEVRDAQKEILPGFNIAIPKHLNDVDSKLLNPKLSWNDPSNFDATSSELINQFIGNFKKFEVSSEIKDAGPKT